MNGYRMIEHTADISVHARGRTLDELFINAATAMTEYLFGEQVFSAATHGRENIELAAPDCESLLVDWLSQLLYLSATKYRAHVKYEVSIEEGRKLSAAVEYAPAEAEEDIKAVTYHGLKIERSGGGYEALITFDI